MCILKDSSLYSSRGSRTPIFWNPGILQDPRGLWLWEEKGMGVESWGGLGVAGEGSRLVGGACSALIGQWR